MTEEIKVAPKCQSNSKDGKVPSLVKELETAKILQELSRRSALGKIPHESNCTSRNSLVVSPTPSCERTTLRINNKRRLCDIGSTPHGFYVPSSAPIGSYNQGSTESVSQTLKLPFSPCSDDDDLSSYTTMTEMQENGSELACKLDVRDGGSILLGKIPITPLMPPPQMRHFNNFSNPVSLLSVDNRLSTQVSVPPPEHFSYPSETANASNHFVNASPLMLMSLVLNANKCLVQNEIPMCYPLAPTQWQQPPMRVSADQASSSSTYTYQNLLCPQHIMTPSAIPSGTSDAQNPSLPNNKLTKKRKVCRMDTCESLAAKRTPYCTRHAGQRKCEFTECSKFAQGKTRFCISHGGGRRCLVSNCTRGARDQKYCAAHGGGRRCRFSSCTKLAVGGGFTCTAHGGGKRCQIEDCGKSAQSSSNFCVRHGGGRKCNFGGCDKVARGKTGKCMSHANQSTPSTM